MSRSTPGAGVLVLGMHRSGTSATAGALSRLGFSLGDRLVPAAADNPKGYYEHADVVEANERLFAAMDRSWDDVRALPGTSPDDAWRSQAAALAARLAGSDRWAIKDPRMSRLLPWWQDAFHASQPGVLLVVRHPAEVAASLAKRDAMPARQAAILWLRYTLEAAHHTRQLPRALIAYDALLAAPAATLRDALASIGIPIVPALQDDALADFVDRKERHHTASGADDDAWLQRACALYDALHAASDPWLVCQRAASELDNALRADSAWIETIGRMAHGAAVRRSCERDERVAAERRAIVLQARLDDTDTALAAATALCEERLAAFAPLQEALAAAEALSLERLEALARLADELKALTQAKTDAEVLANERLNEVAVLAEAKAKAEALATTRLDELAQATSRVAVAEQALATAERLAVERLATIADMHRSLVSMSAAKEAAEVLAVDRLRLIEETTRSAHALSEQKDEAERVAIDRLREVETATARAEAAHLAELDARAQVEALEAELDGARSALAAAYSDVAHHQGEIGALTAADAAVRQDLDAAHAELAAVRHERERHEREAAETNAIVSSLREQLLEAETARDQAESARRELAATVASMESSYAWRTRAAIARVTGIGRK